MVKKREAWHPAVHEVAKSRLDTTNLLNINNKYLSMISLVAQMVKCLLVWQKTRVRYLGWEDPLGKGMATPSSILQRSLAGYRPWGHKEAAKTEQLRHTQCAAHIINTRAFK